MNKKIVIIALLLAILGIGFGLYNWAFGPTQGPSGPIQTIPLDPAPTPSAEPAISSTPAEEEAEAPPPFAPRKYVLSQESSEARFIIYEDLRGQPNDVVGTTNQVSGEFSLDLNYMNAARFGVIQINARTFVTDDNRRNQIIRNRILSTDEFEFITFTPIEILGMPSSASPGETVNFQISGNLTIRNITRPTMLTAEMTVVSESEISGKITGTISRAEYNLQVPNLSFIANVGDEIRLEIDGMAIAVPER